MFTRQRRASLGPRRGSNFAQSKVRTRSMSGRSDFSSTNGDTGNTDDETDGGDVPNGKPSRAWSIYAEDPKSAVGDEQDDPINRYVHDQLARVKSNEASEMAEELASQNDRVNDGK